MLVEGVFGRMENGCPISSWVEETVLFLSVFVFWHPAPMSGVSQLPGARAAGI